MYHFVIIIEIIILQHFLGQNNELYVAGKPTFVKSGDPTTWVIFFSVSLGYCVYLSVIILL